VYWLDTVIVTILLIGALLGAVSGLVWQLARVASFGVALYAAIYLNDWATGVLRDLVFQGADPRVAMVLAYLVVFLTIYLVFFALTVLIEHGMTVVSLQPLNKVLGAGLGAVKAGLVLGAIFLGLASYPHTETQELINRSSLAPALADGTQLVIVAIPQEYKDWLSTGFEQLREMVKDRAAALQAVGAISEIIPNRAHRARE
jgi:membrane protein required for colicin V production